MMTPHLPLALVLLVSAALTCVRADPAGMEPDSAGMERNATYSCCNLTIEFDSSCEATFNINNRKVAYSYAATRKCTAPCRKIEDGSMTLHHCADVEAVFIYAEAFTVTEERIYLHGLPCSSSTINNTAAGNSGLVVWLLLAVWVSGRFMVR